MATGVSGDGQINPSDTGMDNSCSTTSERNSAIYAADIRSTTAISQLTTSGPVKHVKGNGCDKI